MKKIVLLITLFSLVACDSESDTKKTTELPGSKEIKEDIKKGTTDVVKKRGPKWKVDYTGDFSGSIEGGILSVVPAGDITALAGAGMSKGLKGKAPQGLNLQMMQGKDSKYDFVTGDVTLADGTKCETKSDKSKKPGVKVINADRKTYHATINGQLECGSNGKKIQYKAVFKKKP